MIVVDAEIKLPDRAVVIVTIRLRITIEEFYLGIQDRIYEALSGMYSDCQVGNLCAYEERN